MIIDKKVCGMAFLSCIRTTLTGRTDMQTGGGGEALAERKGPRFTKVYPKGWEALAALIDNRAAAKLYMFLATSCGHDNAVVCTYELLAEELGLSERTIRRAVRHLEDGSHVVVAKIGTANAYILNPEEVWKTYEEHKRFCGFSARALASKTENGNLKRRLTHIIEPDSEPVGEG
jgi:hypothetical protein